MLLLGILFWGCPGAPGSAVVCSCSFPGGRQDRRCCGARSTKEMSHVSFSLFHVHKSRLSHCPWIV
ncbi:hypothetical protein M758_10G129700 [Ceratodon purpureus]|nr:hypothetical protein M758_10G129700 [Ceratodon purpureus]